MLNMVETRFGKTFHRNVAQGVQIEQEGTVLQYVREGNTSVVKPADHTTVAANFAGVAFSRNNSLTRMVSIEVVHVPDTAPYTVTLVHAPVEIRVVSAGSALAPDTIANIAPGKYNLTGSVLTFDAGIKDTDVTVSYSYVPSVLESIQLTGNSPAGGLPSSVMNVIGVISQGDVATDMFDVTCDWSTATTVKMGDGGLFTTGSGNTVPGAIILRAPVAGSPSLVVSLR